MVSKMFAVGMAFRTDTNYANIMRKKSREK